MHQLESTAGPMVPRVLVAYAHPGIPTEPHKAASHDSSPSVAWAHAWAGASAVAFLAPLVLLLACALGLSCTRKRWGHAVPEHFLNHHKMIDEVCREVRLRPRDATNRFIHQAHPSSSSIAPTHSPESLPPHARARLLLFFELVAEATSPPLVFTRSSRAPTPPPLHAPTRANSTASKLQHQLQDVFLQTV